MSKIPCKLLDVSFILGVMVDQEVWQATRAVNMFLQDGYQLVHPQKLDELIEEREDQRARIQQLQVNSFHTQH